jgi:hypothetical protein
MTAASLAIGAASSLYSYQQSNQQADAAASLAAQNQQLQQNAQVEQYNAAVTQQRIELERQSQDASLQYQRALNERNAKITTNDAQYTQLSKATREAASTAAVRAAEGGVGGLSVDALMSDYWRGELDSRLALDTDRNSIAMQGSNSLYDFKTGQTRAYDDFNTNASNQYKNLQYAQKSGNYAYQNNLLRINDSRQTLAQTGLNIASSAVNSGAMYYQLKQPSAGPSRLPTKASPF